MSVGCGRGNAASVKYTNVFQPQCSKIALSTLATVGAIVCPASLPPLLQCPWQLTLSSTYSEPTVSPNTSINAKETHANLEF